jgi:hypothetical protein
VAVVSLRSCSIRGAGGGGLQGLFVSLARTINRTLARRGRVFAVRYLAHPLASSTETRRALGHVLRNAARHAGLRGRDPASSAPWYANPMHPRPTPVAAPRTWLLQTGWSRASPRARTFC